MVVGRGGSTAQMNAGGSNIGHVTRMGLAMLAPACSLDFEMPGTRQRWVGSWGCSRVSATGRKVVCSGKKATKYYWSLEVDALIMSRVLEFD